MPLLEKKVISKAAKTALEIRKMVPVTGLDTKMNEILANARMKSVLQMKSKLSLR